jgi:hypothetical protein
VDEPGGVGLKLKHASIAGANFTHTRYDTQGRSLDSFKPSSTGLCP